MSAARSIWPIDFAHWEERARFHVHLVVMIHDRFTQVISIHEHQWNIGSFRFIESLSTESPGTYIQAVITLSQAAHELAYFRCTHSSLAVLYLHQNRSEERRVAKDLRCWW